MLQATSNEWPYQEALLKSLDIKSKLVSGVLQVLF